MPGPVPPPHHLVSPGKTSVRTLLGTLPQSLSPEALLALGAVYLNRRRLRADVELVEGDVLRVHPFPRRFPSARDWRSRIVFEDDDVLVVDKPAGLPVHPTCDNARENLVSRLEETLGHRLWICHRLDIATQGLMALAKSKSFCSDMGRWLESREIHKRYRALLSSPVPEGELIHYMAPGDRAPHEVNLEAKEGWRVCRLEVGKVEQVPHGWEVEITLGTGRHHQIRAQLAAIGAPVLGDALYGSKRPAPADLGEGECIALQAFELGFPDGKTFRLPSPWAN